MKLKFATEIFSILSRTIYLKKIFTKMITDNIRKIIFPPYVEDLESQEENWAEAINVWRTNLSLLLRLQDAAFHKQMLYNDSLHEFIGTFLGTRARSRNVKHTDKPEIELEKKVLAVLLRASESNQIKNSTLVEDLYHKNMISVPFLLDLVETYGKSNLTYTKKILDNIIDSVPKLMQDFEFHSTTVINYIKAIMDKFKEMSEKDCEGENVNFSPKMHDAKIYLGYILDIYITLDCLFTVFKPVVNIFNNKDDNGFLIIIKTFYDEIISLISKLISENESNDLNILKHVLVSLTYHTLDACYFSPLGFTSDEGDNFSFIKSDESLKDGDKIKEMIAKMNEVILYMIVNSQLEKPVQCFVDAPLILDVDVEFDLNGKLTKIKNEICDGDDVEVEYTIISLESLRIMNQETEKGPWSMRLRQKQRRYISRMSNGLNGKKEDDSINSTVEVKSNGIHDNEMYLVSLISQVQEVFPDLGEGFIEACLTTYENNVENVIDRLLTQSLPEHLASLDHSSPRQVVEEVINNQNDNDLLAQRRNIFDDDEFDVFSGKTLDTSRVHKGKMNRSTADKLLDDKSFIETNKESMMNLAYNIMYEDEYDDTYDTSGLDMRGIDLRTVDEIDEPSANSHDKTEIDPSIMHEEKLIKMYQSDPSVFDRTGAVRKSDKRAQLRKITKMTDEQIEGWYIMFQRNASIFKLYDFFMSWFILV
ncbi:hypothetical protein C1645_788625 [Glomus cerebriforme]|uniref:CUE domain-containing protein n=1 Tax=Glomus cerebriforme TaxID=658196 RepID=A0A397SBS8_9GLOM|nr:hypothetical protein C1645_788625 [Glomus cerebriforme]